MNRIKRLIIECKCGRKLFDKMDVALSGDSLLVLVAPCECATHQDTRKNFCELHNTNYALVGYCPICREEEMRRPTKRAADTLEACAKCGRFHSEFTRC